MPRILIITGRRQSLNGTYSGLVQRGFVCSAVSVEEDIIEQIREQAPDLILLEIEGKGGPETEELLQRIKKTGHLPIIALIDRQVIDSPDIDLKAIDDFVIEPGETDELALRVKQLLKKTGGTESGEVIRCGDLLIDLAKCETSIGGLRADLTFREYELLRFLASHPGRVYTRDALLNEVWGYDYFGGDRTVDVHIRRLRSKIENPGHTFIDTVRNIGYRFNCNP